MLEPCDRIHNPRFVTSCWRCKDAKRPCLMFHEDVLPFYEAFFLATWRVGMMPVGASGPIAVRLRRDLHHADGEFTTHLRAFQRNRNRFVGDTTTPKKAALGGGGGGGGSGYSGHQLHETQRIRTALESLVELFAEVCMASSRMQYAC